MVDMLGETIGKSLGGFFHYIVRERNPLGMMLYMQLMITCAWGVYFYRLEEFIPSYYITEDHWKIYPLLVILCYISYINVVLRTPMSVKEQLCTKRWLEPYDEVMYMENNECATCKIEKTARSKHCVVCDECVAHFDHHCIWINGCVTKSNITAFIIYLIMHFIFTTYCAGLYIAALTETMKLDGKALFHDIRRARSDKDGIYVGLAKLWLKFSAAKLTQIKTFMLSNELLTGLGLTCLFLSIGLFFFIFHNLRLVRNNRTTNETYKVERLDYGLRNQISFYNSFIKKTRELFDEKEMSEVKLDGAELPKSKNERIQVL